MVARSHDILVLQEFLATERLRTLGAVVGIVLPLKGHSRRIDGEDAMVGYRDPMGVPGKVLQNMTGAAKRWLGIDNPILLSEGL